MRMGKKRFLITWNFELVLEQKHLPKWSVGYSQTKHLAATQYGQYFPQQIKKQKNDVPI